MDAEKELQRVQEQVWVLQAQCADRHAFQQLLQLYERRLLYYIRRLVAGDEAARDVFQNVWLTVFRRIGTLRAPEAFRVWLYRIAHDHAVRFIRRERRELDMQEALANYEPSDDSDGLLALEQVELVHRALQRLSTAHRAVLALRFLEDLSLAEIADVIGCGMGTTKSRLHYAKQALRQHIQEMSQ